MRARTDMHQLQELVRLHRLGTGAREVARLLGISPNTEREYRHAFSKAGLLAGAADDLPTLEALQATLPRVVPPQRWKDDGTSRPPLRAASAAGDPSTT